MTDSQIILAIESAICGGSISLLRDGSEIANWTGTSNVSKAEELLVNINAMLNATNITKQDLRMIAVSAGPGSFTGIRIGIATALGMKTGLGIVMSSQSALKAMAFLQPDNARIVTTVPMGRNAVCLQTFHKDNAELNALDEPQTMQEDAFLSLLQSDVDTAFVLHSAIYEKIGHKPNIINLGANIAFAIGSICREQPGVVAEPLFISKSF